MPQARSGTSTSDGSITALVSRIYGELPRIAARHMRRERASHTLQPTALVHEACMRLVEQPNANWQNRAHFLAVASRIMRQILVDMLALDAAIERFPECDPRAARIIEMHFFGGLAFEEMALALGVSVRTVKRDWKMARAWRRNELSKKP